jgi:DNA repair exonuclease SbcCD ATPase subunit
LSNIGSLGPGDVILDLNPGLTAVVGANGAGKSTCVNALYFAITGETINGSNFDDLVTWGCVSGKVELDCDTFKITRALKVGSSAKSTLTIGDKTFTRKKEIDSIICEMFGFVDLSVFRLVFFAEQYKAIDLIDGTDAQRVGMLSSLFGFAKFERIGAALLKVISTINTSVIGDDVLKSIADALALAEAERDAQNAEYARISALTLSDDEVAELTATASAPLVGSLNEMRTAILRETENLLTLQEKLDGMPTPPTAEQHKIYNDFKEKELNDAALKDSEEKLNGLIAKRGLQPGSIVGFLQKLDTARNSVIIQKQRLTERANLVTSGKCPLTGGVPCPDLLAMTDREDIDRQLAELDKRIAEMDSDKEEMQRTLIEAQNLEAAIKTATEVRDSYVLRSENISIPADFDVEAYIQARDNSDFEEVRRLTSEISHSQQRINSIKAELDKYDGMAEKTEEERIKAANDLMAHNTAVSQLPIIKDNITRAEERVAAQVQSKEFADMQNETARLNAEKRKKLEKVRLAFHRDNLPRMLIEDILEKLNMLIEQELTEFAFPYKVQWCSSGALLYSDFAGNLHPCRMLSGGQKYVLVLAARCAFKRLLNTSFPFFVLDEPTTGLDVQNREFLSVALNKLRDRYPEMSMVIPTHDQMLLPESNIIEL